MTQFLKHLALTLPLASGLLFAANASAGDTLNGVDNTRPSGIATITMGASGAWVGGDAPQVPTLDTQVEWHITENHSVVTSGGVLPLLLVNFASYDLGYRYTFNHHPDAPALFVEGGLGGIAQAGWGNEGHVMATRAVLGLKWHSKKNLVVETSAGVLYPIYNNTEDYWGLHPIPEVNLRLGLRTKRQKRSAAQ